jgi:hypothetical protein
MLSLQALARLHDLFLPSTNGALGLCGRQTGRV